MHALVMCVICAVNNSSVVPSNALPTNATNDGRSFRRVFHPAHIGGVLLAVHAVHMNPASHIEVPVIWCTYMYAIHDAGFAQLVAFFTTPNNNSESGNLTIPMTFTGYPLVYNTSVATNTSFGNTGRHLLGPFDIPQINNRDTTCRAHI